MNGGKRQGAGRKKGSKASHTLEAEQYRKVLIATIIKHKKPLAEALVSKGLSGDVPALKEIHDRALGKSKESLDITSGGNPIPIYNGLSVSRHNSDKEDISTKKKD